MSDKEKEQPNTNGDQENKSQEEVAHDIQAKFDENGILTLRADLWKIATNPVRYREFLGFMEQIKDMSKFEIEKMKIASQQKKNQVLKANNSSYFRNFFNKKR